MAVAARAIEREAPERPPHRRPKARVHRVRVRATRNGLRVLAFAALPLLFILAYVWLTAELTAQTYRLHDDQARQSALAQRDTDLRQQVARLESLPRLEAAAAQLHMQVPSKVALIAPPSAALANAPRTAIAASLADVRAWLRLH